MRVAVAQLPALREGVIEAMAPLTEEAAARGAELVVFPEGVMHDFHPSVDLSQVAEPLDGPFATSVRDLASRYSVAVLAGMWERDAMDPRPWNTLLMVGPDGCDLALYRKIHLFDSFGWRESERVIPGPVQPAAVEYGGMTFGLLTCYDLRFPELARSLASGGVDTLLLPAGWVAGPEKLRHWEILLAARAIENTVYVAASGLCGPGFAGHSRVFDPMGLVVAALGEEPGIAVADLDPARLADIREALPSLRHRRM